MYNKQQRKKSHLHTKADKKNKSNWEMAMAVRKKEINIQQNK